MSQLKRNLNIIWDETTHDIGEPHPQDQAPRRFIALARKGGPEWGVYDRKRGRYLKNREVAGLDAKQVRETWVQ